MKLNQRVLGKELGLVGKTGKENKRGMTEFSISIERWDFKTWLKYQHKYNFNKNVKKV